MERARAELEAFYRRYLGRCNERRFEDLGDFVDENVEVNGAGVGVRGYIEGLRSVVTAAPDFHWELRHLLVDGCWLSAHLINTGTTPDARRVAIPEFAIYRIVNGRIIEVWGDLDPHTRLSDVLGGP